MEGEVFINPADIKDAENFPTLLTWGKTQNYLTLVRDVDHGWERWAQLGIYFYLTRHEVPQAVESYVFGQTQKRVDLWVHFKLSSSDHYIELKAWSSKVNNLPAFMDDVKSDVAKLIKNTKYPSDGFVWAIGLLPWLEVLRLTNGNNHYQAPEQPGVLSSDDIRKKQREWIQVILGPFKTDIWYYGGKLPIRFTFVEAGHVIIAFWRCEINNMVINLK